MNTIKGTLLAAATAVSLMSTAQADEQTGPIEVTPADMRGAGTAIKVDGDYVLSFTTTTNTYTFTIPNGVESIRYLVVAGGGAGGGGGGNTNAGSGGGGGAGGMLTGEGVTVETGNVLTIKVGAGGIGTSSAGNNGSPSSLSLGSTVIARADGGGGGGAYSWSVVPAHEGGSGGGGNGDDGNGRKIGAGANALTAADSRKQGNAGGGVATTGKSSICASGGGGAGEPGGAGTTNAGGAGGAGLACDITGEDLPYAAGGGGANRGTNSGGAGGSVVIDGQKKTIGGVGGKKADGEKTGSDGKDGTGSGGGGSATGEVVGGKGGDGIVIIRYTPPATSKAKVHFSYDPNTVTWVATDIGGEVEDGGEVDNGATVTVVATPKDGYEYASAPEGWTKNEDDTVTAGFKAEAPECTIQIPAATAIPFTMNFTPGANASYTATVDGQPVQNGAKIRTGKQIVVVATPNTDCEYAAIPGGWSAGEVEGAITCTITAGEGVSQLTIPDAAAIDYVQVQFTSNGSAFYEATNAVGGVVAGRVRAGTEVFVKIWAGVGFVYTETPTGWTWEAEGDVYTKAFPAVSGSTLTIQIPNAREIGGRWTKEIPANVGYKLEVEKDLVYVFTNTAAEGCEMILPSGVTSLRYLVVGGGGAGGGKRGGGGGAGGMLTDDDFKVVGRTLKIKVGQGGGGVKDRTGTSGDNSKLENGIASIVAYGGGGGGVGHTSAAVEGGSGGGGGGTNGDGKTPLPGASAKDSLQGNAGGTSGYAMSAAGGGGAGESGKAGSGTAGGAGGAGRTCDITGEDNKYYAAGGGGASRNGSSAGGAGGSGIGGNGGKNADGLKAGLPGVDGTGSGGGGAADDTDDCSGKGGDGVVILRFKKPSSGIIIFIM